MKIQNYYKNPNVHARIIEYLGGNSPGEATCIYLARCDLRRISRQLDLSTPPTVGIALQEQALRPRP